MNDSNTDCREIDNSCILLIKYILINRLRNTCEKIIGDICSYKFPTNELGMVMQTFNQNTWEAEICCSLSSGPA